MQKRAEKAAIWKGPAHGKWFVDHRRPGAPPIRHGRTSPWLAGKSANPAGWRARTFDTWEEARDFAVEVTGA